LLKISLNPLDHNFSLGDNKYKINLIDR
jgi:hypothetical protein